MKRMILTGTMILALAGAGLRSARAGDCEWATVGKVLTGVVVAGIIVAASNGRAQCSMSYSSPAYCPPCPPPPVYYAPPVVACPPRPVVYCPAPVAVAPSRMAYNHPNRWLHREEWREQQGR